jgi:hypothetical protein
LCRACLELGHRLLLCRYCGERALPLDPSQPATSTGLLRAEAQAVPYTLRAAFTYPFRGHGGMLTKVLLVAMVTIFPLLPGLGYWLELLLPGLLCAIVRSTASGETEVPDWPDLSDLQERAGELFGFIAVVAITVLPAGILLWIASCDLRSMMGGEIDSPCLLLLLLGLMVGLVLAVPALAAVATQWNTWLALRLDRHLRAVRTCGRDMLGTAGLLWLLLILLLLLTSLLRSTPFLDRLLCGAFCLYALIVGAHLIGLVVRRHEAALASLYRVP